MKCDIPNIVGNLKLKQTTYGLKFYITGNLKNYELKKFHKTIKSAKLLCHTWQRSFADLIVLKRLKTSSHLASMNLQLVREMLINIKFYRCHIYLNLHI